MLRRCRLLQVIQAGLDADREVGIMAADLQVPTIHVSKFECGKTMPITANSSILDAECKLGNDALTTQTCRVPKHRARSTLCSTALERALEVVVSKGHGSRGDKVLPTGGEPMGHASGANTLKVVMFGDLSAPRARERQMVPCVRRLTPSTT